MNHKIHRFETYTSGVSPLDFFICIKAVLCVSWGQVRRENQGKKLSPGKGSSMHKEAELWNGPALGKYEKDRGAKSLWWESRLGCFTNVESEVQRGELTQLRSNNFFSSKSLDYLEPLVIVITNISWTNTFPLWLFFFFKDSKGQDHHSDAIRRCSVHEQNICHESQDETLIISWALC